ncbi:helix-turn-helix domain-containing protein [Streptomyces sp. NPDC050988]|uniref:helix-turn-helix domain-containing protein n=1 Tax=Streptomyces sp. NPDC050988 TaxID=3365637 RepID=UPI0037983F5A
MALDPQWDGARARHGDGDQGSRPWHRSLWPFDAFAACLRMLMQRAGLSYGVLARQTDISSSSLHRYCSGSYVPQDYGSVYRFAKAWGRHRRSCADCIGSGPWRTPPGARPRRGPGPRAGPGRRWRRRAGSRPLLRPPYPPRNCHITAGGNWP